jgi:hypothetical protein
LLISNLENSALSLSRKIRTLFQASLNPEKIYLLWGEKSGISILKANFSKSQKLDGASTDPCELQTCGLFDNLEPGGSGRP